ncbi:hypothetical protein [Desulfoplanes sp.]
MNNQNPFSIYDFLGYLIPGSIFTFSLFQFEAFSNLIKKFNGALIEFSNEKLFFLIVMIAISYCFGHALALLSSLFVERYYLYRRGYPPFSLFSYRYSYREKNKRKFYRTMLFIILAPISILDYIFVDILKVNGLQPKKLNPLICLNSKETIKNFFVENGILFDPHKIFDGELFRLIYHYSIEYRTAHVNKIQNYVALYGFCRSISFMFIVWFWMAIFFFIDKDTPNYVCLTTIVLLSYTFYFGFSKFYSRFSLEVIMAFVAGKLENPNRKKKSDY